MVHEEDEIEASLELLEENIEKAKKSKTAREAFKEINAVAAIERLCRKLERNSGLERKIEEGVIEKSIIARNEVKDESIYLDKKSHFSFYLRKFCNQLEIIIE